MTMSRSRNIGAPKRRSAGAEMNTLLLHSEDVNFSLVVWDDEKHTIYIVEYRI